MTRCVVDDVSERDGEKTNASEVLVTHQAGMLMSGRLVYLCVSFNTGCKRA